MKLALKILGIFFLLLFKQAMASTGCTSLTFSMANTSWSFNSNSAPALTLTTNRTGTGQGCDWFYTVSYGTGASYSNREILNGSYTLPIQIYKSTGQSNIIKDFPDLTSTNDIISGTFPSGSGSTSTNVTYYPTLGSITYNRFGAFSDSFKINLYEGVYNGTYTFRLSRTITFNYTMARKIDLSLVDTGAPFNSTDTTQTMSFGNLTANAQLGMDIVIQFNAGYNLKFSSLNNGKLKHVTQTDTVPYSITVGGNAVNLSGSSSTPVSVATGSGVSPALGQRFGVLATIGNLGSAGAGNYSDTITVTVATTE